MLVSRHTYPHTHTHTHTHTRAVSVSTQDSSNLYQDDDQVIEKMTPGVDPEEDSSHFMAILVESLSILGRVKDALDVSSTTLMVFIRSMSMTIHIDLTLVLSVVR